MTWLKSWNYDPQTNICLVIENPNDSDNSLTVAVGGSGNIIVSVSDEKAVDSYNSTFECSISLPLNEAEKVALFILKVLGK